MKLSARQDINVPAQALFDQLVDAVQYENAAVKRGASLSRSLGGDCVVAGEVWDVSVKFRGKMLNIQAEITDVSGPDRIVVDAFTSNIEGQSVIEVVALSPAKTRVSIAVDLKPKTLSARIFLQSLKMTRSRVNRRFKAAFSASVLGLEARVNGE